MSLHDAVSGVTGPQHGPPDASAALQVRWRALAGLLGQEQAMLDTLLRRLVTVVALVDAGEAGFVARAADEVDAAESDLAAMEVARAMIVAEVGDLLGRSEDLGLIQLADAAPPEVATMLHRRREKMLGRLEEIEALRCRGRAALERRMARLSSGLATLDGSSGRVTYEPPSALRS